MSNRSGHVDVNERRLRPIYGQNILTIKECTTNSHLLISACIMRSFIRRMPHVFTVCVNLEYDAAPQVACVCTVKPPMEAGSHIHGKSLQSSLIQVASKLTDISRIGVVMCVSDHFVERHQQLTE